MCVCVCVCVSLTSSLTHIALLSSYVIMWQNPALVGTSIVEMGALSYVTKNMTYVLVDWSITV